ncbi:ELM1/GtrOC1 family putative glycosyltransferase [Oceanipulchritudo coccoides]|uniref:ELM1/GtrOC1 family putative glycosyltransferase n=1 Tax=Oceanipulchritudo coccoides TaxID=2706888 RepID=UPI001EE90D2B|nr:ELM1/GtrOC1 family putative glycosyltransferase [Oceanipulchritudo coccoides]
MECIDVPVNRPRPKCSRPDIIIAAGHQTHWKLLRWSILHRAKSVVLMKPSLPMGLFDLCLVPEHDLKEGFSQRKNLIPTKGVLNSVRPGKKTQPPTGLILIGGVSKEYDWDGETLKKAIETVVRENPSINWLVTDSRRTQGGFLLSLDGRITKYPHKKTAHGWLPEKLASASKCWVTEDSVSMIYEALSSGAQVGLLPMSRKGKPGRVARGIEQLVESGWVSRFGQVKPVSSIQEDKAVLREADRCAELLVKQFELPEKSDKHDYQPSP